MNNFSIYLWCLLRPVVFSIPAEEIQEFHAETLWTPIPPGFHNIFHMGNAYEPESKIRIWFKKRDGEDYDAVMTWTHFQLIMTQNNMKTEPFYPYRPTWAR